MTLRVWDLETGALLHTFDLGWIPSHIAVSPADPHVLVTANANGTLTIIDLRAEPRLADAPGGPRAA